MRPLWEVVGRGRPEDVETPGWVRDTSGGRPQEVLAGGGTLDATWNSQSSLPIYCPPLPPTRLQRCGGFFSLADALSETGWQEERVRVALGAMAREGLLLIDDQPGTAVGTAAACD